MGLRANPFVILDIDPEARLIDMAWAGGATGGISERMRAARQTLQMPRSRLLAELEFLPDAARAQRDAVMDALRTGLGTGLAKGKLYALALSLPPMARANLLAHIGLAGRDDTLMADFTAAVAEIDAAHIQRAMTATHAKSSAGPVMGQTLAGLIGEVTKANGEALANAPLGVVDRAVVGEAPEVVMETVKATGPGLEDEPADVPPAVSTEAGEDDEDSTLEDDLWHSSLAYNAFELVMETEKATWPGIEDKPADVPPAVSIKAREDDEDRRLEDDLWHSSLAYNAFVLFELDLDAKSDAIEKACEVQQANDPGHKDFYAWRRDMVLDPRQRLLFEVQLFPDVPKALRLELISLLDEQFDINAVTAQWEEFYPLTYLNLAAEHCLRIDGDVAILNKMIAAQISIDEAGILASINRLRTEADIAPALPEDLKAALNFCAEANFYALVATYSHDALPDDLSLLFGALQPETTSESMFWVCHHLIRAYLRWFSRPIGNSPAKIISMADAEIEPEAGREALEALCAKWISVTRPLLAAEVLKGQCAELDRALEDIATFLKTVQERYANDEIGVLLGRWLNLNMPTRSHPAPKPQTPPPVASTAPAPAPAPILPDPLALPPAKNNLLTWAINRARRATPMQISIAVIIVSGIILQVFFR